MQQYIKQPAQLTKAVPASGGDGGIRTHVPAHHRQNDFEFYRRLLITWFLLSVSVSLVRPQTRMKSGFFEGIARKY